MPEVPQVQPFFKPAKTAKAKGRRSTRIPPFSDKRRASFDLHDRMRQQVFDRDGGCVLADETDLECSGRMTVHHRRKAGAAGSWSMANLVCLCAGHNVDIEDRPAYYRERWPWLVVREGDAEWDALGVRGA